MNGDNTNASDDHEYVSEMERSVAFYETLGLGPGGDAELDEPDESWNEFAVGDGTLALHFHRDGFIRRARCLKSAAGPT